MKLMLDKDKNIFLEEKGEWVQTDLCPCFPKTDPHSYLSLKNSEGEELQLIESLSSLEKKNADIIKEHLDFLNFKFIIKGIYAISEDFGVRNYHVETHLGPRRLQTELDDWPKVMGTNNICLLYTSPSPRDRTRSRMPSSA